MLLTFGLEVVFRPVCVHKQAENYLCDEVVVLLIQSDRKRMQQAQRGCSLRCAVLVFALLARKTFA